MVKQKEGLGPLLEMPRRLWGMQADSRKPSGSLSRYAEAFIHVP
jgi:hypothetical protein